MVTALGRIRPEVPLSKSRADLDIIATQLAKTYPAITRRTGITSRRRR